MCLYDYFQEKDKAFNPIRIIFLGSAAIMFEAGFGNNLVEMFGGTG